MTNAQRRFLRLHRDHFVESWRQLFRGGMLRARTDKGRTATLSTREVKELVDDGFLMVVLDCLLVTEKAKTI